MPFQLEKKLWKNVIWESLTIDLELNRKAMQYTITQTSVNKTKQFPGKSLMRELCDERYIISSFNNYIP